MTDMLKRSLKILEFHIPVELRLYGMKTEFQPIGITPEFFPEFDRRICNIKIPGFFVNIKTEFSSIHIMQFFQIMKKITFKNTRILLFFPLKLFQYFRNIIKTNMDNFMRTTGNRR